MPGKKESLAPMVREIKIIVKESALTHFVLFGYRWTMLQKQKGALGGELLFAYSNDQFLLHGSSPLWVTKKVKTKIKIIVIE